MISRPHLWVRAPLNSSAAAAPGPYSVVINSSRIGSVCEAKAVLHASAWGALHAHRRCLGAASAQTAVSGLQHPRLDGATRSMVQNRRQRGYDLVLFRWAVTETRTGFRVLGCKKRTSLVRKMALNRTWHIALREDAASFGWAWYSMIAGSSLKLRNSRDVSPLRETLNRDDEVFSCGKLGQGQAFGRSHHRKSKDTNAR